MKQTCILILGMHRSGTSALSGALNILDVYLGSDLMQPLEQNPKGFYENALLYLVNEKLLERMGSSWDDAFFTEAKLNAIKECDELERVLRQEFQYSQLFAIKDPRLAFLFPFYAQVLTKMGVEIKVVIPFRNPLEVADSLSTRNHFSQEKGLLLWAYHFLLAEKVSRGYQRVFTQFDQLIASPREVLELIDQRLGLNIAAGFESKEKQLQEFLTPDLKHHNISMGNVSENLPDVVRSIIRQAPDLNDADLTESLDSLRRQLFANQALFYNADVLRALDEGRQAKHDLDVKQQLLGQAWQEIQAKEQILEQARQGLKVKDRLLEDARQELQLKEQMLEQSRQGLIVKDQALEETGQELQVKNQELEQVRHALHLEYLSRLQAQQEVQARTGELDSLKQELQVRTGELDSLKQELLIIYKSRSWKITRALRGVARKLRK